MPEPIKVSVVKSPIRFVVVAPGDPEPSVLIASTDEVADLVGTYSLREMGLDFSHPRRGPSEYSLSSLLTPDEALEIGATVDVWASAQSSRDDRSRRVALIVQGPPLTSFPAILRERVKSGLTGLLDEIEQAANRADAHRVAYLGSVLAASLANIRSEVMARIRSRRATMRLVMLLYGAMFLITFIALTFSMFDQLPLFEQLTRSRQPS